MCATLTLRSHVGRDLLQTAQVFRNERLVVWEYVANSLQYYDPGTVPHVSVSINDRAKTISISDNGRGMDLEDLRHFFTMHGENKERSTGRIGRGRFGTGKSAAFGIASVLEIDSIRNSKRNVVKLTREAVEQVTDGSEIPVQVTTQEQPIDAPNGTKILISEIHLRRIDREAIVKYVEKQLAHFPRDVEVFVDAHQCRFSEPEISSQFDFSPSGDDARLLGNVRLTVKVSRAPLEPELQGINVSSHGNWLATTLAGCEGKEMSEYLLGEVEVPALEEYQGPIKPFDNTRSGELNPKNDLVAALYRFLGPNIDSVRRDLVAKRREQAKSEEAKKLASQAEKIAEALTRDFANFQLQLGRAKGTFPGNDPGTRSFAPLYGEDEGSLIEGGSELASRFADEEEPNSGGGLGDSSAPDLPTPVESNPEGDTTGSSRGGSGNRRGARGGILVAYENLGPDEHRSKFVRENRTVMINLDHPQVSRALARSGSDVEDDSFVQLSWDVAITEYAVALARMRDDAGHYGDVYEPLFDIRDAIDRLTRLA